jgi:hypothetical protein
MAKRQHKVMPRLAAAPQLCCCQQHRSVPEWFDLPDRQHPMQPDQSQVEDTASLGEVFFKGKGFNDFFATDILYYRKLTLHFFRSSLKKISCRKRKKLFRKKNDIFTKDLD